MLGILGILSLSGCGGNSPSSQESSTIQSQETSTLSSLEESSSSEIESSSSSEEISSFSSEAESSSASESSGPKYDLSPENESLYGNQRYLNYVGSVQEVWDEYRGDGVTIAVIDSGFQINHPEFKFANGQSKISGKSASFSYSGSASSPLDYSSVSVNVGVNNVVITDGDSHGTICATVAAGSITGEGTVGIAPNAELMLLKVDRKPRSIARAFRYAADNGADVITISLGSYETIGVDLLDDGSNFPTIINEATEAAHKKGAIVCSAGGNGGLDGNQTRFTYPGGSPFVIGAGGLADQSRTKIWSGSSYNYSHSDQFCDVFAPANDLYSGCYWVENNKEVWYGGGFDGTSFASPIIAGAAALYLQKNPNATNTDFETALFNSCDALYPDYQTGYGAINIKALMDYQKPSDAVQTYYFEPATWWSEAGAKTSVYAWNDGQTSELATFPGKMMELGSSGRYSFSIDTEIYDRVLFTRVSPQNEFWGAQTIDLDIQNFKAKSCYSIKNTSATWVSDGGYVEGEFVA